MKLDRLNELLLEHRNALGLPEHRSQVGSSGNNLHWLRKIINGKKDKLPDELISLVNQPISLLSK